MTICIAALCDSGRACVVAADRQVTIGFPLNVAFEHHESKIDKLTDTCLVLSAGNALIAAEVTTRTVQVLAAGKGDVQAICMQLRDVYMQTHVDRAEQLILRPRGMTLEEFKTLGAARIPLPLYQNIDQLFWNFALNTEFLLAGVDDSGGHIGWVHYHGMQGQGWLEWFDKLGYQAIGTGGSHAAILLSVTGQHPHLTTPETVYNVYSAKVNAEVAPGVGGATDMAVVTKDGVEFLTEGFLNRLGTAREASFAAAPPPNFQELFDGRKS